MHSDVYYDHIRLMNKLWFIAPRTKMIVKVKHALEQNLQNECDILTVSGSNHMPPMGDQGSYKRVEMSHSFCKFCSKVSLIFTIIFQCCFFKRHHGYQCRFVHSDVVFYDHI